MEDGAGAEEAMASVLASDPGRSVRQLGMVDSAGRSATFSGDECEPWYGGTAGRTSRPRATC